MSLYFLKATVTTTHTSNYPNPICFASGDVLILGELDEEYIGWIKITTADGNTGWAPIDYIDVDPNNNSGLAKCSYNAKELNTKVGEELRVLNEYKGWYFVSSVSGEIGWVPIKTVALT